MKNKGSIKVAYLAAASSIHTVRWVNEMCGRGHRVSLITMHPPGASNHIDNDIDIFVLPFPAPSGYYLNKWYLKTLLRRLDPNLLHTHYASGYGTLSRLAGFRPTVLSIWGSDVFDFPKKSLIHRKIFEFNLMKADYICSTSQVMAKEVQKYTNKEIKITPFGVDCQIFRPVEHLKSPEEIIIGTVKSLENEYGIEYLIKAFAMVKHYYRGTKKLKLVIAGGGLLEDSLKNLVLELGLSSDTEFLGQLPHNKVPEILNKLSIYVAVSIQESFGVAVLEASACNLPVIVSDVGGLPEIVKDNETGIIVPYRNVNAIADAIKKLLENDELRNAFGIVGRNHVLKNYEWNENASRMEKLYIKIIEEWS